MNVCSPSVYTNRVNFEFLGSNYNSFLSNSLLHLLRDLFSVLPPHSAAQFTVAVGFHWASLFCAAWGLRAQPVRAGTELTQRPHPPPPRPDPMAGQPGAISQRELAHRQIGRIDGQLNLMRVLTLKK